MKKLTKIALAATAALGLMLSPVSAAEKNWEKPTDFQKRLTPERLPMMQADYSGTPVKADAKYLADRFAIINTVTAYSYLIDEGRWDEWFALFSDDILFESTVPCFGTVKAKGMKAFKEFTNLRYRGPGSEKNRTVRRHFMGNIHVAEQTETTAEVRTYMMITAAPPASEGGKFTPLTSGTYNASLEKRDGKWIITRWYIEVDAPVNASAVPKGFDSKEMQLIPDTSCKKK